MTVQLPRKRRQQQRDTVTDRVLAKTSNVANVVAERWDTTKVEVYRFLVELAWHFDSAEEQLAAFTAALQPEHLSCMTSTGRLAEVAEGMQEQEGET